MMAEPPPIQSSAQRRWGGWIVLVLFFALAILTAVSSSISPNSRSNLRNHEPQQVAIRAAMTQRWSNTHGGKLGSWNSKNDPDYKDLDSEITKLAPKVELDAMSARLYLAMEWERNHIAPANAIAALSKSKLAGDRAFADIYRAQTLTRPLAENLIQKLPDTPAVYKAAKVHALEKAGVSGALDKYFAKNARSYLVVILVIGFLLLLSLVCWVGLVVLKGAGLLVPKGLPLDRLLPQDADRLGEHAAIIILLFQAFGLIILSFKGLRNSWGELLAGACEVGAIVYMQRVSLGGTKLSLKQLGLAKEDFWKNVGIGFGGFLLEFPIAFMLAGLGLKLFSGLPTPTHPASEALQANHSFLAILPVILSGAVIAPFWEELAFRGLLFPAFNRFIGLVPSIFATSLLFASVHPQGPVLWMPLACVGVTSCLLSYHTKSLVPSMVMHCLHNSLAFGIALISF